jgi:hypothetical protein
MTRITDTLLEDLYTFFISSRAVLLRMRNVSHRFVEKIKTHIYIQFLPFFPRKSCRYENEEEYRIAGEATDDNMAAHAHFMLHT